MVAINEHYLKLKSGYLFPEIARRVTEFSHKNPQAKIIRLGIGDVTLPLPQAAVEAGKKAFEEMGQAKTFHGYSPEQGYAFLRERIIKTDYLSRGVALDADEIFVSDGAKCDTGNIQEIFAVRAKIAVPNPVYPVYVDANVMAGRTGQADRKGSFANLVYLKSTAKNNFVPDVPKGKVDLIYLCFPNNPTGAVATKVQLKKWVEYARANKAVILFDAAYEAFIADPALPHSIYEIDGARECAIEFRSFSKSAGFTGTRCAWTVVPKSLKGSSRKGGVALHSLWHRRQTTKFNGVSYPVQRAAEACLTPEGRKQTRELIAYYLENAKIILSGLVKMGLVAFGGVNAPYVWFQTPDRMPSWTFFDKLLREAHVVATPGAGFGACGEGYMRLSAFGERKQLTEAMERMKQKLKI